jgi:uncharacterized protein (TIGR02145 family)
MKTQMKLRIIYLTLIGAALLFLTACNKDEEPDTVVDASGNVYQTMIINNKVWMKSNLRTTEYSNGTGILMLLHDDVEWASAGPACTIYQSDIAGLDTDDGMVNTYGILYNWYSVTASTGLCPTGWRVATESDWDELITSLGGETVAGGKLKSQRTDPDEHPRWDSPNIGATNEIGFNILPSGYRSSIGDFTDVGYSTYYWCPSEYDASFGVCYYVSTEDATMEKYYKRKRSGYPVRCVKE